MLLSWVYDAFNEVPYLRLRGDFGSGKTRFLLTVGALCNKPIFASGASTVSPIFHTLDAYGESFRIEGAVTTKQGEHLVPYSPQNNLIRHDVVLLPSAPEATRHSSPTSRSISIATSQWCP